MAGLRQTKSFVVNIKTLASSKSKANGRSSKLLIIGDKVHYAPTMVEDRLTTASAKQEISLVIGNSNDYRGKVLFIVATANRVRIPRDYCVNRCQSPLTLNVSLVLVIRNTNNGRIVDKVAAMTEIIRTSPPINSHKWL